MPWTRALARLGAGDLATGHEDADRVTVAFLVATAALTKGREVVMFREGGGELLVCPICFDARMLDADSLVPNARIGGATPLWEWIGDEPATVFSY